MEAGGVRLFIDESLSPLFATRLNASGEFDAVHPLHTGRRGEPDHRVLARCLEEDRVIVTQNARDFRRLIGTTAIHPGLIILPSLDREGTWLLLLRAIDFLAQHDDASGFMVNRVLEVSAGGDIASFEMPHS